MNSLSFGLDEVFCEDPLDEDLVEERLEFALRFALLPASRHRVRNATHLGSKGNLAETVSALTGQLMRETSLRAITFWLKSPGQGVRGWLRRTEDRIESLAGSVRMDGWEEHPGDRWGLPRRSKAHRWQLQTKDEMAWWVPLAHRRRIIGYLELVFPSSVSADIEVGVLRVGNGSQLWYGYFKSTRSQSPVRKQMADYRRANKAHRFWSIQHEGPIDL